MLGQDGTSAALLFGLGGPRLLDARVGRAALERTERAWGERDRALLGGKALAQVRARIADPAAGPDRIVEPRANRLRTLLAAVRGVGLRRGADPVIAAPEGAVLLNATHFPLEWARHVAWLDRRPDIRLVALVHDLLALDHPGFFWSGEPERHRTRLALLSRRGAGAIVTSTAVAERLDDYMRRAGRTDFPLLRAAPPVSPIFEACRGTRRPASGPAYFVACGTIEPRKNHALLLDAWRRLAAERGQEAPRLVVVGKRGWLCDEIVAAMRHPALAGLVVEVAGLATADYADLLAGSRGLLAPSFAEGFGLPVAEALAGGVPVVASDIPPFREQAAGSATLLDPRDAEAWHRAIVALSEPVADTKGAAGASAYRPVAEADYVAAVRAFLEALP